MTPKSQPRTEIHIWKPLSLSKTSLDGELSSKGHQARSGQRRKNPTPNDKDSNHYNATKNPSVFPQACGRRNSFDVSGRSRGVCGSIGAVCCIQAIQWIRRCWRSTRRFKRNLYRALRALTNEANVCSTPTRTPYSNRNQRTDARGFDG